MVSVHKSTNREAISKWLRHAAWKSITDFFTQRGLDQVASILVMKGIRANVWFTQIEHHLSTHVFLDICEDMEELLKLLLPR